MSAPTSTSPHGLTPSQTVGPFLHIGLPWPDGPYVVPEGTPGAVRITGTVTDGAGAPVPDGMVESWQADPHGNFDHPDAPRADRPLAEGFRGFGRCPTDGDGRFWLYTVKPGPLPTPDGRLEAPHLTMAVFARGLLRHLVTRLYFDDEAAANAADPVLGSLDESARQTLVATATAGGYQFDIRLRGADETVFFEL